MGWWGSENAGPRHERCGEEGETGRQAAPVDVERGEHEQDDCDNEEDRCEHVYFPSRRLKSQRATGRASGLKRGLRTTKAQIRVATSSRKVVRQSARCISFSVMVPAAERSRPSCRKGESAWVEVLVSAAGPLSGQRNWLKLFEPCLGWVNDTAEDHHELERARGWGLIQGL